MDDLASQSRGLGYTTDTVSVVGSVACHNRSGQSVPGPAQLLQTSKLEEKERRDPAFDHSPASFEQLQQTRHN